MKKLFVLILAVAFFYIGCDESTDPDDGGGGGNTSVTKIEGKLPNWTYGTNKTIKFFIETEEISASFGEASIGADGSFSITLQTPTSAQLTSLVEQDSNCTGNQTINPSDTKGLGGGASFQIYEGTNVIGNAQLSKRMSDTTSNVGDVDAIWVYLSGDATINGTETCTYNEGGYNFTFTMSMSNLGGKKGWNKYFMTQTGKTENSEAYSLGATEPSGMAWQVDIWGGSSGATISGTLPNWTYGTGKTIKYGEEENGSFYWIGEGVVNADGSFLLNLQTPAASKLDPIFAADSFCTGTATVTPPDLNGYTDGEEILYVFDGAVQFGRAFFAKMAQDTAQSVNDYFAVWVYLDKNGTLNGTEVCTEDDGGIMQTHTTIFNNLTGIAGWNKYFWRLDALTSNSTTATVTSVEPSGMNWKFYKDGI